MNPAEFPHSEISGSMDVCSSPKLIAAYHVFRRLPVPRHSPCALCSLTVQMLSHLFLFQILHLPTRFYRLVKLYCLQLYHGFNILLLISCFAVLYSVFKVHPPSFRMTCIGRKPISWFPVVGWNGLEPSTSRLSAECSNQLSYQPKWWR